MVIVMLVHYARPLPFPEGAPAHSAGPTGDTNQLERPRRLRLACNISRNRALPNGYQQTIEFGHYMKGHQEVGQERAHSRLSSNRFFPGVPGYLDIVVVKDVEDLKVLFEASLMLAWTMAPFRPRSRVWELINGSRSM